MSIEIGNEASACELASRLLKSDQDYLDNINEIWAVGLEIYNHNGWGTEFHIFGVIESATDHLPTKNVRQYCSEAMLERTDKEISNVISFYKNEVEKACNEILQKYGNT